MSATNKTLDLDIEKALEKMEAIIEKMESKQLKIKESLSLFEDGLRLAQTCQQSLTNAELKIEQLTKNQQIPS